jgi:hypothetical protein
MLHTFWGLPRRRAAGALTMNSYLPRFQIKTRDTVSVARREAPDGCQRTGGRPNWAA